MNYSISKVVKDFLETDNSFWIACLMVFGWAFYMFLGAIKQLIGAIVLFLVLLIVIPCHLLWKLYKYSATIINNRRGK